VEEPDVQLLVSVDELDDEIETKQQPQPIISPLNSQPISEEEPDVPRSFLDVLFEMEGYPLIPLEDRQTYGKYDIYGVYNHVHEKSADLPGNRERF
jgi:hypothetical protein